MSQENHSARNQWTVGTLSYTTAGLVLLFCWLLAGDFAWSMKERGVANTATLLVKSFGVSDFVYSLLIVSFPNFTSIFLGPIVSYLSDRHRGRFGRRIPYLAFTTPFIVTGLIGLAFTPMLANRLAAEANLSIHTAGLLVFGLFWILLDFGTTLANVIFVALVNDVVPAAFLGRFFGLFRAISLGAGILFNYFLLGKAETCALLIFLGLGILYGIGFTLMCVKVREGEYPPLPEEEAAGSGPLGAVRNYFRECFSLGYYRWVIAAYVAGTLAALPLNAYTIFYAQSMDVSMDLLGKYLALTYVLSFVLSYPLGMLADRFHPIRTSMAAIFGYFLFSVAGIFCVRGQVSFAVVFVLHGVISGCFSTLSSSYAQRLFPKSIFAQFNSAMMMVMFAGFTVTAPLVGKILDWSGNQYHYVFHAGGLIALVATACFHVVLKKYRALGGDEHYRAPLPEFRNSREDA